MLVYKTELSNDARRDINKLNNYLDEHWYSKVISRLDKDIEGLKYMPRANKTMKSYIDPKGEYRRMISGKYSVIYKIENYKITIMRIFNQKQNYLGSNKFILREESLKYEIIS